MDLGFEVSDQNGCAVLTVRGEVDAFTAPTLREQLVGLVGEGHHDVVVDLEGVDFIDSTGLGVLVGGLKRMRSLDGDLVLVCTQNRIIKLLELTGLTNQFTIHPTVDAAVGAP